MRIWHQSLTVLERVPVYRDAIAAHAARIARPGCEVVLHGMRAGTFPSHYPGVFITHVYLQDLHREQFVKAGLTAQAEGYDAMFISTIPDVGLQAVRTLTDMPVVGYGEASFHVAAMLGDCIGVVNFITDLAAELRRNAAAYGLKDRLGPVVPLGLGFDEVAAGYADPGPVIAAFEKAAREAIARGADVIVPGEGPLNIFLASHGVCRVDDVPVVDSIGTGIKLCESLADLRRVSGMTVTRRGFYHRMPPAGAFAAAREFYGLDQLPEPEGKGG